MPKAKSATKKRKRTWKHLDRYYGKPTVRYAGHHYRHLKTRVRRNWHTGKNSELLYIERMSGQSMFGLWTNAECVEFLRKGA